MEKQTLNLNKEKNCDINYLKVNFKNIEKNIKVLP